MGDSNQTEINKLPASNERAVRLFTFLREFVELQSKVITSTDQYEKVLWVKDFPVNDGCSSIFLSRQKESANSGTWVEIIKPDFVAPPAPPEQLAPWINQNHLNDSTLEVPALQERTANPAFSNFEQTNVSEYLDLKDCRSEISPMWETYVENHWWPWAKMDRLKEPVHKVYSELYSLFQRQYKLGEAFEVILGLGCLQWNTKAGEVSRHMITAQTNLVYDPKKSTIVVQAAPEGPAFTLEQDMLPPEHRLAPETLHSIRMKLQTINDLVAQKKYVFQTLKEVVEALHKKGRFDPATSLKSRPGQTPVITYSPAIILRRRTDRSLIDLLETMSDQLRKGNAVPPMIERLTAIKEQNGKLNNKHVNGVHQNGSAKHEPPVSGKHIFFPLPSNEEQRTIVDRCNEQRGVVVQGPPGTGKSHTIANLISHLLASGKRVLVTSQSARALRVLEKKLPDELSALCVMLLGDDMNAQKSLEQSVERIIERSNAWDLERSREVIEELETKLDEEQQKEQEVLDALRALREVETYDHPLTLKGYIRQLESDVQDDNSSGAIVTHQLRSIASLDTSLHPLEEGGYQGSLQTIAMRLRREEDRFSWFVDRPTEDKQLPMTCREFEEFIHLLREIPPEEEKSLRLGLIDPGALVDGPAFQEMVEAEADAREKYDRFTRQSTQLDYPTLPEMSQEESESLSTSLTQLIDTYESLRHHTFPWVSRAASDVLSGQHPVWNTLLSNTQKNIEFIKKHFDPVANMKVTGLRGRDLKTVREHASRLQLHLTQEGNLGFGPFRPKVVREGNYLIESVRVDGVACDNTLALQKLLDFITILERFETVSNLWSQYTETSANAHLSIRLAEFESLLEALNNVFWLYEKMVVVKNQIEAIDGLSEPHWNQLNSIRYLREAISGIAIEESYFKARKVFRNLEQTIIQAASTPEGNSILNKLLYHIRDRNHSAYALELKQLASLWLAKEKLEKRSHMLNRLAEATPLLLGALLSNFSDPVWEERAPLFEQAWHWSKADRWLDRMSAPQRQEVLALELENQQENTRKIITKLTAMKAWHNSFSQMSEHQRQHLIAWSKAVKNLGKGTGKSAMRHRQIARENLEQCRDAIPAWVMPIYRIAETVVPEPEMFDVVIVDEASQSGPEALFLLYLAKQVVVVGDEKQISPYFIGISKEDVETLRQKYLSDLPHNETIGLDNSFFDQAEIRFGNPVRLREHFRCMPEIIQFSNQHFYPKQPLVPLRQYGGHRLAPVIATRHISGGFAESEAGGLVNVPEAEAIAAQIQLCIQDEEYAGKSMGVVSLQGVAQARYIEKLLLDELGPDLMAERNLACGDSSAFQGDERDIIFLSMVAAPNRRMGTLSSPKDERRFNVAVSRARDQVWLFHSPTLNDLSKKCLRYKLLSYFQNPIVPVAKTDAVDIEKLRDLASLQDRKRMRPPQPFESWFEVDVYIDLIERGFKVLPQYEVDRHRIDLVIEGQHQYIALECDGEEWLGQNRFAEEVERQRMLERCGWVFLRVRGGEYYRDPRIVVDTLCEKLEKYDIVPQKAVTAMDDVFVMN